jgi:hypothetical protein
VVVGDFKNVVDSINIFFVIENMGFGHEELKTKVSESPCR